ncbi:YheC/YheD family protein [Evansella tamaricis]|uniref:YheC/YheD family protein n=1 Tax=Evansella tamaricis TaxID=2069301 RepID=A0ABS6JKL2_9BACI|nr:YheC/YheD family protein [Evansella tamaricis]MBU9712955.1 YheC/YheD family protein [Evansella tamaricis]
MDIGIMTNFNKPTKLAELTSLVCKSYNIEIIYLTPNDIEIDSEKVTGKVFTNNKWKKVRRDIPKFIDVVPYCFTKKNKNVMDYLRNKTYLSDDRSNTISKEKLQNIIKLDDEFSTLVIPTHQINKYDDILHYLDLYSTIVMKPSKGLRGKGIYILSSDDNSYNLGYLTEKYKLSNKELFDVYEDKIKNKGYILQKYITSRTKQGDPFDCRIHVEKNGNGEWESAKNYIRIGIGQKVISNVNQGGGISDPKAFLKANFGDQWEEINSKLNDIAVTLPYKIEELRKTHIMSLGFDIGIDKTGKLYLFEVNDGPSTAAVISEVAMLRSKYYKFVIQNILNTPGNGNNYSKKDYNSMIKELNTYESKYSSALNELDVYKNRLLNMEKSTSWRITAPIRLLGDIKKKIKKS